MACTPTPTQTLFEVLTTSTLSTSTSEIVTTIPPELSTILSTFCGLATVDVNGTTTCASTETSAIVTTISSEQVKTVESQVVLQIPVTTSLPTSTLFSTCPSSPPPSSAPPPTQPQSDKSIIISSITTTAPNGSTIVTVITSTATIVPTWALIPTEASGNHSSSDAQANLATIIGSTLGGFVGLLIIVFIGWSMWRKRNSIRALHLTDQMWSNDRSALYGRRTDIDPSVIDGQEPKPYQYGIVGRKEHETTPSRRSSPNVSPAPTRPQSVAHTSLLPGPGLGPYTPGSPPHSAGLSPAPYTPDVLAFSSQPPTPNAQHAASPYSAIPSAPPSPSPAAPAPTRTHRVSDSVVSVGTAVSYPYQVPVPLVDREDEGAGPAEARRPKRMSLKLANWNPDTDGEL
ncbi:hypothetical protein GSI_04332 [Ganoderma sinense ZZ0214-1]|uniref:Uncharacterized protein n=1 Tax=Ganoderma sinense ZZ0214-1 TaxID=1077348 RepID=A0A2G8SJ13_9APHY|nr:hypothetical protein GSI_04332 [Ganoderma sinense ZZ0214-1]